MPDEEAFSRQPLIKICPAPSPVFHQEIFFVEFDDQERLIRSYQGTGDLNRILARRLPNLVRGGWIDGQLRLYQLVLRRMRDLGMRPVLPAFAGFVPPAITRFASSTRLCVLAH